MTERDAYIAFSVFPGIGPMRFQLLIKYFGSALAAWGASEKQLEDIHFGKTLLIKFIAFRSHFDSEGYGKALAEAHVRTVAWNDTQYPKLLKEISDPPIVLYIKSTPGMPKIDMEKTIAVVGTRKATPYGKEVTERITAELVENGFTIISGMAYGIDAVAHSTAIHMQGKTIAVLGCGVDIIAPPSNAGIYKKLTEDGCGAVVSEMPLGLRPNKGLFPARNRVISGLSRGVLVTEGADDSGALITARYAGDQGRDVFAVPGPITSPYSKGPAFLLKQGAVLVESAQDIIHALGFDTKKKQPVSYASRLTTDEERSIMACLSTGEKHVDVIVGMTHLPGPVVFSTLTVLEMKGIIKDIGEKVFGVEG